jgi:hypothetical protein
MKSENGSQQLLEARCGGDPASRALQVGVEPALPPTEGGSTGSDPALTLGSDVVHFASAITGAPGGLSGSGGSEGEAPTFTASRAEGLTKEGLEGAVAAGSARDGRKPAASRWRATVRRLTLSCLAIRRWDQPFWASARIAWCSVTWRWLDIASQAPNPPLSQGLLPSKSGAL